MHINVVHTYDAQNDANTYYTLEKSSKMLTYDIQNVAHTYDTQ